jgi:hypothetical protein
MIRCTGLGGCDGGCSKWGLANAWTAVDSSTDSNAKTPCGHVACLAVMITIKITLLSIVTTFIYQQQNIQPSLFFSSQPLAFRII